jgi:hypothetical protein
MGVSREGNYYLLREGYGLRTDIYTPEYAHTMQDDDQK